MRRSWGLWIMWFVLTEVSPTFTTDIKVFKKSKGEELSVRFPLHDLNLNLARKVFCRNHCEEGDILVETSGRRQTNGRYSIKHERTGSPPVDFITVEITNLALSDSGRYRCLWDPSDQDSYLEFGLEVTDGVNPESVTAGEDFRRSYYFEDLGDKKTFCRNSCSEEDILVVTTGDEAQKGRYKIQYEKIAEKLSKVTVTIKTLSPADSGTYQIHLDKTSIPFSLSIAPVTLGLPAALKQDLTTPSGGSQTPLNLTMILVLVSGCVALAIITTTLKICRRRHTRTDQGAAAGGGPQSSLENTDQDLCLVVMEPDSSK